MSRELQHSPADIVSRILIDMGLAADPELSPQGSWPAYVMEEPSTPDDCITVYDLSPRSDGRVMVGGETQDHYGIKIRVRCARAAVGYVRTAAVKRALAEDVRNRAVTLDGEPYTVACISKFELRALGMNTEDKRSAFQIEAKVCFGDRP